MCLGIVKRMSDCFRFSVRPLEAESSQGQLHLVQDIGDSQTLPGGVQWVLDLRRTMATRTAASERALGCRAYKLDRVEREILFGRAIEGLFHLRPSRGVHLQLMQGTDFPG